VSEPARAASVLPLTERVIQRLPGPRLLWVVAWALVGPLRPIALLVIPWLIGGAARPEGLVNAFVSQAIFGYVVLLALWASPRLVHRVTLLAPSLVTLAPGEPSARWFSRLTSVRGPLVLTAIAVAIATPTTALEFGTPVALVDAPLLAVMILPIMTFVWAYSTMLVGLDQLGQSELALDLFPQDRSLGLGPLGGVAVSGFWLLVAAGAPLLLLSGVDITTFATSVGVLLVTVLLFILSMLRLHSQMRAAKARYVAMAHALVAEAYGPMRTKADLETLQANSAALNAAQSLAERAERILEWPIDERMVASMTVVITGVVTSLVVRLVLEAIGV
jgi:hypothetical protein